MSAIIGYSQWSAEKLLSSALAGEPAELRPGDYCAIVRGNEDGELKIATAPVAAFPYFYALNRARRFCVGSTVYGVAAATELPWEWNIRAVRCLALFGHTIGRDTLHSRVFRLPNDMLIEADARGVRERSLSFWRADPQAPTTVREVLGVLHGVLSRDTDGFDALLSLSAGYDSRLLLAVCLSRGLRPRCVTMGPVEATDVEIASALAKRFDLPHARIELDPEDYLEHGPEISRLTSGSTTAGNWHTYLYSRAARGSEREIHLVGTNGEFARNFFLPGERAATVASLMPPSLIRAYWLARLERRRLRFRDWPLISTGGVQSSLSLAWSTANDAQNLASALDVFYATQRVRHFMGNGLALYAANGRPRSPFLDAAVIAGIRRLPKRERMANRFHRACIEWLEPSLLDFPFNAPLHGNGSPIGYSPFAKVRALPRSREIVMECTGLDDLVPRSMRERLLKDGSDASFELILTLAFAANCAANVRAPVS